MKKFMMASFLILFVSVVFSNEVEEKMKKAEAALNGGEVGQALEIYQDVLKGSPDHLEALKKAAMLSSWQKEYSASIGYYEKVLRIDPGDTQSKVELADVCSWNKDYDQSIDLFRDVLRRNPDDREVRLKMARVLSWSKQYPESITEYKHILAKNPEDKEARLELARVLSWKGDFKESEAEFRKMKSASPDRVEVLTGLGNTLAWQGKSSEAEAEYRNALKIDPQNPDAQAGLAKVLIWRGERREAKRIAQKLAAEHPQNEDVQSLNRDVRAAVRPYMTMSYDRVDDSEDNTINIYRADFIFRPEPQTDLGLSLGRYDLDGRYGLDLHEVSASVDSYALTLGSRLNRSNFLYARLGSDQLEDSAGESDNYLVGALSYTYFWKEKLQWGLGGYRDTFKVTAETIINDILVDSVHTDLSYTVVKPLTLALRYERSEFSDGNEEDIDAMEQVIDGEEQDDNTRDDALFSIRYATPFMKASLAFSYRFRYLAFDENLDSGYFDPQQYVSNVLNVEISGRTPNDVFYYGISLDGGLQNFHFTNPDGTETKSGDDSFFGGSVLFGFNIARRAGLEFYYMRTDYALQVGTGYESSTAGAKLRFQF